MDQMRNEQMETGKAHAFQYQSNDMIAVLEDLKDEFLQNNKDLDKWRPVLPSSAETRSPERVKFTNGQEQE